MYSPTTRRSTSTSPTSRRSIQLKKCANPNAYVRCVYDPRPQHANHPRNSLASRAPTPGPITENRAPDRPAAPRSISTTNAPATPTNPFLVADAQATYPVGRITRQAQDQVAPLPPPARPAPLDPPIAEIAGDSHQHLIGRLDGLAGELGYTVQVRETPRGDGYCDRRARQIVIAERLSPNARVATGIHELAHALVDVDRQAEDPKLGYAEEELIAESVAYTCCRSVGLATDENSIPYLASWAEHASVEVLEQTAAITGRLAQRIEDALLAAPAADEADDRAGAPQSRLADCGLTRRCHEQSV